MDDFDRKILTLIQDDDSLSVADVADRNLTPGVTVSADKLKD